MHEKQHIQKERLPYQVLVLPYFKEKDYLYAIFKRSDLEFWQGISGGGEGNELPLDAAKRETVEETGIDSEFMKLDSMTTIPAENIGSYHIGKALVVPEYAFGVKAKSKNLRIGKEHSEYRWLPFREAHKLLKYDSNKTALWELNQRLTKEVANGKVIRSAEARLREKRFGKRGSGSGRSIGSKGRGNNEGQINKRTDRNYLAQLQ